MITDTIYTVKWIIILLQDQRTRMASSDLKDFKTELKRLASKKNVVSSALFNNFNQ